MDINPILAAKLEFLATALTGVAAQYAMGKLSDDDAATAVNDCLEAFTAPVTPESDVEQPASAVA